MTLPRVVMASMWRNDVSRQLVDRVEHLLSKAEMWPTLSYLWIVGDSTDGTAQVLADLTMGYGNVTIRDIGSTGIEGDDAASRLKRLSVTANHYFTNVRSLDYLLIHESDIVSPYNLVPRLVALAERGICPVAAWPMLEIRPGHKIFYDVACFIKDGVRFGHRPPYHKCYRPDAPFEVHSFGTCFLMHAEDAPLIYMRDRAVLDLCDQLRQMGRTLWVDPTIEVCQPKALWEYTQITKEYA